jgi:hypothetical protein
MKLEKAVLKLQKWFRGCSVRIKRLPMIMYVIQNYLESENIKLSSSTEDGRVNSCLDEGMIIKLLVKKFPNKIKKLK